MAFIFQTDLSLPRHAPRLETLNGAKHSAQFFEALKSLEPIVAETIPKTFQLKSKHRGLPDVFQGPAITFVSDPVKELIETLEPEVHQFIEVEILDQQGKLRKIFLTENGFITQVQRLPNMCNTTTSSKLQ